VFIIIIMENTRYNTLIGNPNAPFIHQFRGFHHRPGVQLVWGGASQPAELNRCNLRALHGVVDDSDMTINVRNIVAQLQAKGKTWKAYMQSYSLCTTPLDHGYGNQLYQRKHNPFISDKDVQANPARLSNILRLEPVSNGSGQQHGC
jgi:hypothetical protein